jgi:TonB family protein
MERPLRPVTEPTGHGYQVATSPELQDVYSADEIARAAGVHRGDVLALAEAGLIRPLASGPFYSWTEAVASVRTLSEPGQALFRPAVVLRRQPGMPIAMTATLHAAMLGAFVLMTSLGVAAKTTHILDNHTDLRMVFLVSPGPGGGGGGGGLKQPTPPPPAERKGVEHMRSPVAVHHPPVQVVAERRVPPPRIDPPRVVKPVDPPPIVRADPVPAVFAPVVPVAPDPRDRTGVPWKTSPSADSAGPGSGGSVGTGQGTGIGEGNGSGIGAGSGGGTGGGPYRPGAGITAPSIQREVRPDYTEEGRRRAIEGDVVLEIVVRADGSVGSITLLQGLGAGLNERAMDAVRQWRFNPARRYGTPVDVIVEVAVEFKLR